MLDWFGDLADERVLTRDETYGEDGDMELKKNMDAIVEDFKCYIGCLFIFRLHRMS